MTGMAGISGSQMSDESSPIQINKSTILLQRADPAANLIGQLHASRIAFSDIRPSESIPLIGTATGPGLLISHYPTYRPAFLDNLTFAGLLFDNWNVELYRNGEIFDYRPSSPENSYTFKDVPLLYGREPSITRQPSPIWRANPWQRRERRAGRRWRPCTAPWASTDG